MLMLCLGVLIAKKRILRTDMPETNNNGILFYLPDQGRQDLNVSQFCTLEYNFLSICYLLMNSEAGHYVPYLLWILTCNYKIGKLDFIRLKIF